MNLATATPAEIDTELAKIQARAYALTEQIYNLHRASQATRNDARRAKIAERITELTTDRNAILAETGPYNAEFNRRGGWTRAFVVQGGHVHRSTGCHTLHRDTDVAWLPEWSGRNEQEIVDKAKSGACTHCYASAPVIRRPGPSEIQHPADVAAAADRAKRDEDKAKRAKDKAAKAITNPDGTPLRVGGTVIATEASAQSAYFYELDWAEVVLRWNTEETESERIAGNITSAARHRAKAEPILAALAAKRRPDEYAANPTAAVEAERAALAPKAAARKRKGDREWAATAERRAADRARLAR